jgi:hypothetical protein
MVGYPAFIQYPGASKVDELLLGEYVPETFPETGRGYVPVYHAGFAVSPSGEVAAHAKVARSTGSVPVVTVSRLIISAVWQAPAEPGTVVGTG